MLEFGKLNGGLNSPKHCYNISQGHKVTVVDTHQKIGLAVVVNYQADRFKQHLDICMMMCKVICSPSINETLFTAFLALLCWIFLDLGGS